MKKVAVAAFGIASLLWIVGCNLPQNPSGPGPKPGSVSFQLSQVESELTASADIADADAVIVTIKNDEGADVYENEELELVKFEGTLATSPLSLVEGAYSLTNFAVVDDQDEVLFATPHEDGDAAHLVEDPAPIAFQIIAGQKTTVVPEVVDVTGYEPGDFGFAEFSFEVVETFAFQLAVFAETDQGYELTESQVVVLGGTTLYEKELAAGTHVIALPTGHEPYTLQVVKPGFVTYEEEFTQTELEAYFDPPLEVFLDESDGVAWQKEFVDGYSDGNLGMHTSITTDQNGFAHISYRDQDDKALRYATNATGVWVSVVVDDSVSYTTGEHTDIAVDADGYAHISYWESTNGRIRYATNAGGSWTAETVEETGDTGRYSSIAVDTSGRVHLSYYDEDGSTNGKLKYVVKDPASGWASSSVVDDPAGDTPPAGMFNSLALDAAGDVHISYQDENVDGDTRLKYAHQDNGVWQPVPGLTEWANRLGYRTSLALDSNGSAHIVHSDTSAYDMTYTTNVSGSWVSLKVDEGHYFGIAVDASDNAHVSYSDEFAKALGYATNASGSWETKLLDGTEDGEWVGRYSSIAIDEDGYIHISYYDVTNKALKYATTKP
jgi:hypothetical protein